MTQFGPGFIGAAANGNDIFTKVLLHLDGNLIDNNAPGLSHIWTNHGPTFAAGQFGSAINCGGYIDTPDSADFTLGTSDFTIDFWFNVSGGAGNLRYAFGQLNSAGTAQSVAGGLTTANKCFISVNGGTTYAGAATFTAPGWHHFAVTRGGGTMRTFVDGVLDSTNTPGAINDSADNFAIGRGGAFATNAWNGLIDEFRLSVGIARWTANFTPPTSPYS